MLKSLQVRNFAIIDELTVDFHSGLNVLTGETGAGKSIIFSALSVLLGGRFSSEMLRSGARSGSVEALFDLSNLPQVASQIARQLTAGDGDEAPTELLLARTMTSGKSRATINGALATTAMLRRFGEALVNFHGQHQHQRLLDAREHRAVLDTFGGLTAAADSFAMEYRAYSDLLQEWRALQEAERQRLQRQDLLSFQIAELEAAAIEPGEDERLEQERSVLRHAVRLGEESHALVAQLYDDENSIVARLGNVARSLGKLVELDRSLERRFEELEGTRLQLEVVARDLQQYATQVEHNPARLEEVEFRLDALRGLRRKYGNGLPEVATYLESIKAERAQLATAEERLQELAGEADQRRAALARRAIELSRKRRACAELFAEQLATELQLLRMRGACFDVRFHLARSQSIATSDDDLVKMDNHAYRLAEYGIDDIEFYFTPNIGEEAKPLARIASGGELSRIMLAMKKLIADGDAIPCLVFDEVDAGIGGETAVVVGEKLNEVAARHQVLCITHLPQIAAQAHAHYCIEKDVRSNRARTRVRELNAEERVEEIARMSGGETITSATREHAREMLKSGAKKARAAR